MKIKAITLAAIMLALSFAGLAMAQSPGKARVKTASQTSELESLRSEYIEKAKDYKTSLEKLLVLYEADERKSETRFAQSNDLYKQVLISKTQLDDSEQAVAIAKDKVKEVHQRIEGADAQIAQALIEIGKPETKAKLAREYRQASARQPTCRNWTLTASRQQRGRTVTLSFRLVCRD